ncbi:MAG: NADH-quinone oxidoreductase subunit M, partial [Candidatus Cloacimonetes bacterium]|nr:NADH-quinone oxidoreductase subunit M [Candidatus Cloacimonadota bacterium]
MGLVSLILLLPLLTALALLLVPGENKPLLRGISFVGSLATLVLSLVLAVMYWQQAVRGADPAAIGSDTVLHFSERLLWFPSLGIQYLVGLDGISAAMLVLTGIIIFTAVLASWTMEDRLKEFFVLLFVLVAGVFGVFVSFDLFLFLVCYEVAVLPMYLLIGIWGTGQRKYAAMKLTLMLLLGSAGIIVGFLALYHQSGLATFDLLALGSVHYPPAFQQWVFPAIFIGFGVIGALYPFHTWSPDGHASAPTGVSMLHAGVLMKLGGYGVLRIAIYLLPEGAKHWALAFLVLTTINIVYGSLGAIRQKDLKYFTAYSSVSHCGFILFGLCTLNLMGFKGAVIQMFSHGIMTGLFFGLIGMVYGR